MEVEHNTMLNGPVNISQVTLKVQIEIYCNEKNKNSSPLPICMVAFKLNLPELPIMMSLCPNWSFAERPYLMEGLNLMIAKSAIFADFIDFEKLQILTRLQILKTDGFWKLRIYMWNDKTKFA